MTTSPDDVRRAITDRRYTYKQKVTVLAGLAENLLPEPAVSPETQTALAARIICDEGHLLIFITSNRGTVVISCHDSAPSPRGSESAPQML